MRRAPRSPAQRWLDTLALLCCAACALVCTHLLHAQEGPPPPALSPWDERCGAAFVDGLWRGYARTAVLVRRRRDREACIASAATRATEVATDAFGAELRRVVRERYPEGRLPPRTMPLTSDALREMDAFWDSHMEEAWLLEDMAIEYPMPPEVDWEREVLHRDMMRDLKALLVARSRAAGSVPANECPLRPEERAEVEAAFDTMMWRLFQMGEECARMYVGFGGAEVERLLARAA
jgi:hypothetical protein